jgi:enoyl-CoA hydratase/carnithine racemase
MPARTFPSASTAGTLTTNGLPISGGSTLTMPFGQSGPKFRWNARSGCCGSWKPGTAGQPARAGWVSVPSAIRGYALGGGYELALCADLRYVADTAKLGQPEIQLGIIPGAGGTQRLPRLIGLSRAKELIYSGRQVRAEEALAIGMADRVLAADDVYETAVEDARVYANGPRIALKAAKRAIDAGIRTDLRTGLRIERDAFVDLFDTKDQENGMRSLLENGPGKAEFEGK